MSDDFQVTGSVAAAAFTLKIHRGEGMALLAMNWKGGKPPDELAGFAIEYREPGGNVFYPLKNRLNFEGEAGSVSSQNRPMTYSTLVAPIQKFRWVHFPRNANKPGKFEYRVTPVFMSGAGDLSYGVPQTAQIALARETYPGTLNVAFTRGFVSSQAFLDRYLEDGDVKKIDTLLPQDAKKGLTFKPTHPRAKDAYFWMGFEARRDILDLLDAAVADTTAKVDVIAYDLNLPEIVDRLAKLKARARVIIDNSKEHTGGGAAEDAAEQLLVAAGVAVKRQKMSKLQHNKTFVVNGQNIHQVLCGSTNMSWRGLFVQSNNAVTITGAKAVGIFSAAFEAYWSSPSTFRTTPSAQWQSLGLTSIDVNVAFSPHNAANSVLDGVGKDVDKATSSIFYSLAFLAITPGVIRDALVRQAGKAALFVSGISDTRTGVKVASGSSNRPPTYVSALEHDAPSPFRDEPSGLPGTSRVGTRMHHKFIVLDFDKPSARVYLGSYNMSASADGLNGDNLVLIRDRRIATSYMIEAVRIIDHYEFRVAQKDERTKRTKLALKRPPAGAGEKAWWAEDYADVHKIKDRELFS